MKALLIIAFGIPAGLTASYLCGGNVFVGAAVGLGFTLIGVATMANSVKEQI